jgi:hypothetical protein
VRRAALGTEEPAPPVPEEDAPPPNLGPPPPRLDWRKRP